MKHLFLLLTLLSFSLTALAQQKVTGKVKDSSGEPVIGASVVVKGNNTMGTITDFDGNFTLDVPENGSFEVSYIGYLSQTMPIKGKSTFIIELKEDTKTLDEVVVIGYGAVKKSDLTSSISTVKGKEITETVTGNAMDALQGKINGVQVTSGAIGASLKTLQNKSLIELDNKKYEIYDSIFKEWLKKEYEEKGDYPY